MNRTISLGFLAALALLALPSRAHASYTCPSYTETFEAYPSEGDTNHLIGVRCILFFQSPDPRDFAWYGEGDWGNFKYRHIGTTLGGQEDPFQFNPPYINARAADLSGNGESGNSFTAALHISTSLRSDQDRQGRIPAVIRVTSPWHEVWFHVDRT